MDLRLVCKKINNGWIEGLHLDKFVLCIKNHAHLEEIVTSSSGPKWTNVKIICDAEMHNEVWINNPLYASLLVKLADNLTILTLEEHRVPHSGLLSILSTCKALKTLDIGTLDCKNVVVEEFKQEPIIWSLGNLEHLLIRYLAWSLDEDLILFNFIVSHCTKLVSLKAPHILMASLFSIGDTDDEVADRKYLELVERRLTQPIINLVKSMRTSNSNSKVTLRHVDVDNLHHTEVFPTMIKICWENNIKLLNLSEAFEGSVADLEMKWAETVESLNGFTSFLDFNKLVNLRSITLDTETSADSAVHKNSIGASLPRLKQISFCLPEDIDRSILEFLLEQPRPSVTTLSIEFEVSLTKLANFFNPMLVANNFENLSSLSLIQWDGCDSDMNVLLRGFPKLKSLRLQRCLQITDKGLMGENLEDPLIVSLTGELLLPLWQEFDVKLIEFRFTNCCYFNFRFKEIMGRLSNY